jgi:hypothetical protein
MLKMAGLLTHPTQARRDAPYPMQGRNSAADHRFTFHASRFTVPGSDARTPLAGFFSILLKVRLEARRGLVEYCCGGAREGFVVRVVEGIDAELDQAGRQQVEEFF